MDVAFVENAEDENCTVMELVPNTLDEVICETPALIRCSLASLISSRR